MRQTISLLFIIVLFANCSNSGDDKELIWMYNDLSDYSIYVGSSSGPVKLNYDTIENVDSLGNIIVEKYFSNVYNARLFSKLTVAFNENRVTYVDSVGITKTVAPYQFEGDSLFIKRSNGEEVFVAQGNQKELYRRISFLSYPLTSTTDTIISRDTEFTKNNIANYYSNFQSMTNPTDTVVWINIRYMFQ